MTDIAEQPNKNKEMEKFADKEDVIAEYEAISFFVGGCYIL